MLPAEIPASSGPAADLLKYLGRSPTWSAGSDEARY